MDQPTKTDASSNNTSTTNNNPLTNKKLATATTTTSTTTNFQNQPTTLKPPSTQQQEEEVKSYAVLYYKPTRKVHKCRGVSKSDGILTIFAPPLCTVKLYDANDEVSSSSSDSEDDDDDDVKWGKGKGKKKKKKQFSSLSNKRGGKRVIYSGINKSLAAKVFEDGGLEEEEVICVCSSWECQIVELQSAGGGTAVRKVGTAAIVRKSGVIVQKRKMVPLASRKFMPSSSSSVNNFLSRPKTQLGDVRPTTTVTNGGGVKRKRNPLAQPKIQSYTLNSDEDNSESSDNECTPSTMQPPSFKKPTKFMVGRMREGGAGRFWQMKWAWARR